MSYGEEIKEMCTKASFERGEIYFEEGRVDIIKASKSKIHATVHGTDDYEVEIDLTDGIDAFCDCPYDWEGYCKHIVATILAYDAQEFEIDKTKIKSTSSGRSKAVDIDSLLDSISPSRLRDFLKTEIKGNPSLKERFVAWFSEKGSGSEKPISEYKDEIESSYEDAKDKYDFIPCDVDIDLSQHEALAKLYALKGDFIEAAKIYRALSEVVAENMDNVDDSYGSYGMDFTSYLESFVDCVMKSKPDRDELKDTIRYLAEQYIKGDPDYFQDDYKDALEKVCTDEELLRYLVELLKPNLPQIDPEQESYKWDYSGSNMLSYYLDLLKKQNDMDQYYAILEQYQKLDPKFCLLHAKHLLEDGDTNGAQKVAEDGVLFFNKHNCLDLKEFLCGIYKERDHDRYKETLYSLFLDHRDWKYYERLKAATKKNPEEWQQWLSKILENVGKRTTDKIDVLLKEGMNDAALSEVIKVKELYKLDHYFNKLAQMYPEQYFKAYSELIFPYMANGTGRKHYQDVVQILRRMKQIKGYEKETMDVANRLRRENSNRPAFQDEMKNL